MLVKRFGKASVHLERDPTGALICRGVIEKADYGDTMRTVTLCLQLDKQLAKERAAGWK